MKYLNFGNLICFKDYDFYLKYEIKPSIKIIYENQGLSLVKKASLKYGVYYQKDLIPGSEKEVFLIEAPHQTIFLNEANFIGNLIKEDLELNQPVIKEKDQKYESPFSKLKFNISTYLSKFKNGKSDYLMKIQEKLEQMNELLDECPLPSVVKEKMDILDKMRKDSNLVKNALEKIIQGLEFGEN